MDHNMFLWKKNWKIIPKLFCNPFLSGALSLISHCFFYADSSENKDWCKREESGAVRMCRLMHVQADLNSCLTATARARDKREYLVIVRDNFC